MTEWILTLIGPDRPGLVEAVAERVVARGGNWMASRLAHLGGKFAGIAHVSVPEAEVGPLIEDLSALEANGLVVQVEEAGKGLVIPGPAGEEIAAPSPPQHLLQVVGSDRPGIVREISGVLAAAGINVESLSTEYTSAPMSGGPIFRAEFQFLMPPARSIDQLRSNVEAVAGDLMVEISQGSSL
ncbi:MAG: glycine cleavage system protein R [Planctomycetaceae bacterium]|nr:glycine cleavage system protein R [Planctomycetaceae bacterium]